MDEEMVVQAVDINRSPPDALERIPGIGPKLAQRILAARPFTSLEDLMRVNGIGPQMLERIRPYLTVSSPETALEMEDEPAGEAAQPGEAAIEASPPGDITPPAEDTSFAKVAVESEGEGASSEAQPSAAEKPAPEAVIEKPLTRRDFVTWMAVSNLVTLFLALFLSLLFLWLVNGTLRYATVGEFRQLRADTAVLAERLDRLQSDLEDLGGRVAVLERDTTSLKSALESAQKEVQALRTLVDGLDGRLSAVEKSAQRFDAFLQGLRQLLTQVQSP